MNINPKEILFKRIIIPTEHTEMQQVGIDLTIDRDVVLYRNEFRAFRVNEEFNVPETMFALIYSRSTWNRKGIIIRGTVIDPGYHGKPKLSAYNFSFDHHVIEKNTRVCQVVFFNADAASKYAGKYQMESLCKC